MKLDPDSWRARGQLPRSLTASVPLTALTPPADFQPIPQREADDTSSEASEEEPNPQRRRARKQRRSDMTPAAAALIDPFPHPGLEGLGAPLGPAGMYPDPFGLPGQGEFAPDRPDAGVDVDAPTRTDNAAPEEEVAVVYALAVILLRRREVFAAFDLGHGGVW